MAVVIEQEIWTVLSNLPFLITSLYLFIVNLYIESFTYVNITLWSSLYHLCYNCELCVLKDKSILQFMDFFSSYLCIGILVVYLVDINPRKYKVILQCIVAIILLFLTCIDYFNTSSYVAVLVTFIPIGAIYFLIYLFKWIKEKQSNCCLNICFEEGCIKKSKLCNNKVINWIFERRTSPFHPIDIPICIFGILLFTTAYLIQIYVKNAYWITHSIWHVLSAISAMLIYNIYNKHILLIKLFKLCCKKNDKIDDPQNVLTE
jgi:hypothetical protein